MDLFGPTLNMNTQRLGLYSFKNTSDEETAVLSLEGWNGVNMCLSVF